MARGGWSFLQEYAIYDYINARYEQGQLRLNQVISGGVPIGKDRWRRVPELKPIIGTRFPDIQAIRFERNGPFRPAEVKFTTSLFGYHQADYSEPYARFKAAGGCILVLSHDYMPHGVDLDVYVIDRNDFVAFCRENFDRLLNRQIKAHAETKVWVMYVGNKSNLFRGTNSIPPAVESGRWCPTENLTGYDLAAGDRVLFTRTSGAGQATVEASLTSTSQVPEDWCLDEIVVGKVTSTIQSRREYCHRNRLPYETQLWANDPRDEHGDWTRWKRVFEFETVTNIQLRTSMKQLLATAVTQGAAEAIMGAFLRQKSREVKHEDYRDFIESYGRVPTGRVRS